MTSLDVEYKLTKHIKQGTAILTSDFKELAKWLEINYDVGVLNIISDTINAGAKPRLQIILEHEKDAKKLNSKLGFDEVKQLEKDIPAKVFKKEVSERLPNHKSDNIWIVIRSFERPAKEEAAWSVSKGDVETLQLELNIKELWKIHADMYYTATFFLYTNEQVKQFLENGMKEYLAAKYFEILKQHDEFGYYHKSESELNSKENFEEIYQSNWFNYDRR